MSETANARTTVVVGTDRSRSSLRAVARAGAQAQAQDAPRDDAYQVVGSHPAGDTVRTAAERASAAGAGKVRTVAVEGSPGETLLVVGNRGLDGIRGRLLGSVPAGATRRSQCDVLIVPTTG